MGAPMAEIVRRAIKAHYYHEDGVLKTPLNP